jgi:hypothetical protein
MTKPPPLLQLELTWSQLMALRALVAEHLRCPTRTEVYVDITNQVETTIAELCVVVMQTPKRIGPADRFLLNRLALQAHGWRTEAAIAERDGHIMTALARRTCAENLEYLVKYWTDEQEGDT